MVGRNQPEGPSSRSSATSLRPVRFTGLSVVVRLGRERDDAVFRKTAAFEREFLFGFFVVLIAKNPFQSPAEKLSGRPVRGAAYLALSWHLKRSTYRSMRPLKISTVAAAAVAK